MKNVVSIEFEQVDSLDLKYSKKMLRDSDTIPMQLARGLTGHRNESGMWSTISGESTSFAYTIDKETFTIPTPVIVCETATQIPFSEPWPRIPN